MINKLFLLLIIIMLSIFTLTFLHARGTMDRPTFDKWASDADLHGIVKGYEINSGYPYPPLSLSILYLASQFSKFLDIEIFGGFKTLVTLFLFTSSFCFLFFTRDIYLTLFFHLSLMLNSVVLGYVDIFFVPPLIISIFLLKKNKLFLSSVFFSFTVFIKYQPLIVIPFLTIYLFKIMRKVDHNKIFSTYFKVFSPPIIIFVLITIIFGLHPLVQSLKVAGNISSSSPGQLLSGNALNLNWIITHTLRFFNPDYYGPLIDGRCTYIIDPSNIAYPISRLLFILVYCYTSIIYFKRDDSFENFILFSILGFWVYFNLNIAVHENHLIVANILAIVLYHINKKYIKMVVSIILISNINMFVFYGISGSGLPFNRAVLNLFDTAFFISISNLLIFILFWFKYVFVENNNLLTYSKKLTESKII